MTPTIAGPPSKTDLPQDKGTFSYIEVTERKEKFLWIYGTQTRKCKISQKASCSIFFVVQMWNLRLRGYK